LNVENRSRPECVCRIAAHISKLEFHTDSDGKPHRSTEPRPQGAICTQWGRFPTCPPACFRVFGAATFGSGQLRRFHTHSSRATPTQSNKSSGHRNPDVVINVLVPGRSKKEMRTQALRYYMHDGPAAFRFHLAGHFDDESARRLEQDWRTASSVIGDRLLIVGITLVTSVANQARSLLARWHASGARLIANSPASHALAQSILGTSLPEPPARSHSTCPPFHQAAILLLLAAAIFPFDANAAILKPETVANWEDHLRTVNSALEDRCHRGGKFLWVDEAPERLAKVPGHQCTSRSRPLP
jgi:hypothetical protein